jgi:hypothetical protein
MRNQLLLLTLKKNGRQAKLLGPRGFSHRTDEVILAFL